MAISREATASPDLSRWAPAFVTCSVEASVPTSAVSAVSSMRAARARCRVPRRHCSAAAARTPPPRPRRSCQRPRGRPTTLRHTVLPPPTTRPAPTSRMLPLYLASLDAPLPFFQQGRRLCLSVEPLLITLFFRCYFAVGKPVAAIDVRININTHETS